MPRRRPAADFGGNESAASGLVSVMPQPWTSGTSHCARTCSMSAGGTADPPLITTRTLDVSTPVAACRAGAGRARSSGHAAKNVARSAADRIGQRRRREVGARHHHVGARQEARVRQSPRVGVEHRHDHQHPVALADRERVGRALGERVDERRPMAVGHALRAVRWSRSCSTAPPPTARRRRARRTPASPDATSSSKSTVGTGTLGLGRADDDQRAHRASRMSGWAARIGSSEPSAITTRSSAWCSRYASSSAPRRRLTVCSTAPMLGTAR